MANESSITTENKYFTFSGTEMTPFIKFKLYKANDVEGKEFYIKLGKVSEISGVISAQKRPRMVIGRKNPIGVSSGVRIVTGSIVFEIFEEGVLQEIQKIVEAEAGIDKDAYLVFEDGNTKKFVSEINNMFAMPPFSLLIVAVKENNENIRMMKVIENIVLSSTSGAIGINTLTVQEAYEFIATKIVPFTNQNLTFTKNN